MNATLRQSKAVDELMEQASKALSEASYFEAERVCVKALDRAWALRDYERMARICLPLQEARRQRRLQSVDTGRVFLWKTLPARDATIEAGMYLLQPPLIGMDARVFRELTERKRVATLVLAREPTTKKGTVPMVGVATGPTEVVSIRAYVKPWGDPSVAPPVEWMEEAAEALGDAAIAKVEKDLGGESPAAWRVDDLLHYLDAHPAHEKLHQALERECRLAAKEPLVTAARRRGTDNPFSF